MELFHIRGEIHTLRTNEHLDGKTQRTQKGAKGQHHRRALLGRFQGVVGGSNLKDCQIVTFLRSLCQRSTIDLHILNNVIKKDKLVLHASMFSAPSTLATSTRWTLRACTL